MSGRVTDIWTGHVRPNTVKLRGIVASALLLCILRCSTYLHVLSASSLPPRSPAPWLTRHVSPFVKPASGPGGNVVARPSPALRAPCSDASISAVGGPSQGPEQGLCSLVHRRAPSARVPQQEPQGAPRPPAPGVGERTSCSRSQLLASKPTETQTWGPTPLSGPHRDRGATLSTRGRLSFPPSPGHHPLPAGIALHPLATEAFGWWTLTARPPLTDLVLLRTDAWTIEDPSGTPRTRMGPERQELLTEPTGALPRCGCRQETLLSGEILGPGAGPALPLSCLYKVLRSLWPTRKVPREARRCPGRTHGGRPRLLGGSYR